jgi:hypothetical protein
LGEGYFEKVCHAFQPIPGDRLGEREGVKLWEKFSDAVPISAEIARS